MTVCIPEVTDWGTRDWSDATPQELTQKLLAETLAWTTLETLTGYHLSICPMTVRPTRQGCGAKSYYLAPGYGQGAYGEGFYGGTHYQPYIGAFGRWYNHVNGCACNGASIESVKLAGPVGRVVGVEIDGIVMNPQSYRVDNGDELVRQDGEGWPVVQDMSLPAGDPGTFTVTYFRGTAPDILTEYAAGVLAREYLKAMTGERNCRLPSSVKAITRQGVTYDVQSSMFDNGMTGIAEVDQIIGRLNPFRLKTDALVMSIDTLDSNPRQTNVGPATWVPTPPPGGDESSGILVPDPANPGYYILQAA